MKFQRPWWSNLAACVALLALLMPLGVCVCAPCPMEQSAPCESAEFAEGALPECCDLSLVSVLWLSEAVISPVAHLEKPVFPVVSPTVFLPSAAFELAQPSLERWKFSALDLPPPRQRFGTAFSCRAPPVVA